MFHFQTGHRHYENFLKYRNVKDLLSGVLPKFCDDRLKNTITDKSIVENIIRRKIKTQSL